MSNLKIFSKEEIASLALIIIVLIAVAVPNFVLSLRRARDQVRRDDLGSLVRSLEGYYAELGVFPPSSPDGRIMDCLKPGEKPYQDKEGHWIFSPIPCDWGKDKFLNLITGKTLMPKLPRDPNWQKGATYYYISDGVSYQVFAKMEGTDEPEVDPRIIAESLPCGNLVCNVGRYYGCDIPKTLKQCEEELKK